MAHNHISTVLHQHTLYLQVTQIFIFMEPKEQSTSADEEEEVNDSPIEQVRLTVPITDDPTLPVLTFRTWVLGPASCVFISIFTQYAAYRQLPIPAPLYLLAFLFVPIGKLMAKTLPTKTISILGTKWTFSMNPGPFNIKEHALLVVLLNSGLDGGLALEVIPVMRAFYHKKISFLASFLLVHTSQMIGYGFAGIFIKFLVNSPYMWWPLSLPDIPFYRMLHEVEVRPKGQLSRSQFFMIVIVSSFAYYIIPSYFFPSLMALSFVCWIWKDSVTAHQIGSGLHGLGIGSFTLNWMSMITYAGNPLAMPMFTMVNVMVGFILITYIIAPIGYWTNSLNAKRFPFISLDMFDVNGQVYDVPRIINDDLSLNQQAYDNYSVVYLSVFYIFANGLQIASEAATLTHFILFHAREVLQQFKQGRKGENQFNDVHNRLMKKYETIPQWWFCTILISTFVLAILTCRFYGKQFQLPYWMLFFSYVLPFLLILPSGVIQATTGQQTINIYNLSQLLIGWIYPGKPIANMVFQSFTTATLNNAQTFLSDFKLGHYMKIPPKSMFISQIVGTFISSLANLATQWLIFATVDNICDVKKLPEGSPWTCPIEQMSFTTSVIWGMMGPRRMFTSGSQYSNIYIFIIIGVTATVITWILARTFPEKKWIQLINIPIILLSGTNQPPAGAVNYWSTFTVVIIFNFFIYRYYKEWWAKYNYLLSNGLLTGIGLVIIASGLSLQMKGEGVYGLQWWGLEYGDHCHLAKCPTAPGIKVDGCPVF